MAATLVETIPPGKSTRGEIVDLLSKEWPLSCRKIYNALKKRGLNMTYQAVHKAVLQMVEQGVLVREGQDYSLNLDWVNQLGRFSKDVEDAYVGAKPAVPQVEGAVSQMDFNRGYDVIQFILDNFVSGRFVDLSAEKIEIVGKVQHLWNPFVLMPSDFARLKSVAGKLDARVACRGSTALDKVMSRFYGAFGVKVALGVEGPDTPEIIVIGDTVIQIFNPAEMRKQVESLYQKTKNLLSLDMVKIFSDVAFKEMKVTVLVNRNPVAAATIREEVQSKCAAKKKGR